MFIKYTVEKIKVSWETGSAVSHETIPTVVGELCEDWEALKEEKWGEEQLRLLKCQRLRLQDKIVLWKETTKRGAPHNKRLWFLWNNTNPTSPRVMWGFLVPCFGVNGCLVSKVFRGLALRLFVFFLFRHLYNYFFIWAVCLYLLGTAQERLEIGETDQERTCSRKPGPISAPPPHPPHSTTSVTSIQVTLAAEEGTSNEGRRV